MRTMDPTRFRRQPEPGGLPRPDKGSDRPHGRFHIGRRVRSWLRMNAGGAPNTCKSNGTRLRAEASGERLSNTWRTRPLPRDSPGKPGVIPDAPSRPHGGEGKAQTGGDGSAAHQVDGGVTAHRADDG